MKKGNCFEKYQSSGCMGGLGNSIDVLCGSSWKDDLSIGPFYVQFFSCCTSFDYPQLCKKNCYLILDGTGKIWYSNIRVKSAHAGVAQLVEQLICNQQVGGSSPSTSSTCFHPQAVQRACVIKSSYMGEFPSGQREQTVNLSSLTSVVRIHPLPPDYVPDFTVRHIFLSIHAGLRAFFRFKKGLVSHYCHPRF